MTASKGGAYSSAGTGAAPAPQAQESGGRSTTGSDGAAAHFKGKKPQDEDEQAAQNVETMEVGDVDPLDKGHASQPTTDEKLEENDGKEDTGPSPSMTFPLLDVEPNTITSSNTDDWMPNMAQRVKKPKMDPATLAYETVVANIQGHKKAYNSSTYGKLDPDVHIAFQQKENKRQSFRLDPEALQDSVAESSFGFHKPNTSLAEGFKREMRTFVQPNSHYHGGPTMFKRGLNQFRNKSIRKETHDPNPEKVEVAVQNARDAFVLNKVPLYGNDNSKLQFKTNYNETRAIKDSTASGAIAPPTTWFGVQGGVASAARDVGYNRLSDQRGAVYDRSGNIRAGALPPSYGTERPMVGASQQRNTGPYAVFNTYGGNHPAPGGVVLSDTPAAQT
jgi:hypothetical protein